MSIDEQREELRRSVEGLNELGALIERVEAHAKYLSSISIIERNELQRVWVAAYEGVEFKMSAGTEESLREASLNLVALDRLREATTNKYLNTENEQPRFSFFRRRRR